ncbi:MAG TPA: VacJ family lipoprotein [Usitatibacter sp.]|jgi:phospholipid-binding lipoprotein MlaA|nr:VacJ family lipoprotein [Usitatibacter sp.]
MRFLAPLFLAALLSGCATTGERDPKDPWEGFNRGSFAFNEAVDSAVLKPVARGYQAVIPAFAREGVNNFFDNLEDIGTGLNNILQGKPKEGASDLGRFVVNAVLGVFGLWDIATPLGLEKHYEDFGQTLGVWGLQSGPYFVIPLLGPSSARDAPARFIDPQWYWPKFIERDRVYWSVFLLDKVRIRANLLQSEKIIDEAALDKYSFIRDAWLQRRRNQVYDGSPPRLKEEDE